MAMQDSRPDPPARGTEAELAAAVLAIVRRTYADLHRREYAARLTPATALDRDLQFDSLARVELVLRLERSFGVRMPEAVLESAETCGDLIRLLASAGPARMPAPPPAPQTAAAPASSGVPDAAATLDAVLDWYAQRDPQRVHLRLVEDPREDAGTQALTYGELRERADRVAAGIQRLGAVRGDTVAIMLPTSLDYFVAYFGILRAGCVPVPIYPPLRASQVGEHVRRHAGILDNAQAVLLITVAQARGVARLLAARVPSLRAVAGVAELERANGMRVAPALAPEDIAFIQYTSGSTGRPKGVVLSHANLLANIRAFGAAAQIGSDAVLVSWLPLYHDMGLIGTWLSSLYYGASLIVMSPLAFLARPERWLWAIHRYRGTHTVAPNFAYALCVKRIDEAQLQGLDLRSLRVAGNGSEQVQADTLEQFAQRFAPFGLARGALLPVYGLAECTVGLLVPPLGRGPRVDRVRRAPFMREGLAQPAAPGEAQALAFVCCGRALPGHAVRIVDAAGAPLPERREGRLQFRGPSATRGYFRDAERTRALHDDGWLDSGDRAYAADGEIYVTGRIKDIVIRGGRNLYPDELEEAVGAVPGIRRGCVAAFGVPDRALGTERLVIVAETRETVAAERERLRAAAAAAVFERLGEPPDEIVLAPPGSVLKTSSGKLRRAATRDAYVAGSLGRAAVAARWQVLRLVLGALPLLVQRLLDEARAWVYPAWSWTCFAVLAPLAWLCVAAAPQPALAWRIGRGFARLLLRACGVRLRVAGAAIGGVQPAVLVANHASYLDGLMLMAALPDCHRFVAKRELADAFLARVFLQRIGAIFVERFAVQRSVDDTRRLVAAVAAGERLAVFPEGTFTAAPALLPFHLGAFVVAARTGARVIPVAIRGTRALLPAGRWAPRRGPVDVLVAAPLEPARGEDVFAAALALRDAAHARIAELCGEPVAAPPH